MHGNLVRIALDYAVAQLNSHPQNLSWIARYPEFLCFATFFRGFYFEFFCVFWKILVGNKRPCKLVVKRRNVLEYGLLKSVNLNEMEESLYSQ
jgi:hypothetical protein